MNRLIVTLQRRKVVIGVMRLLPVPGRKSGKLRTTPVSPLAVEGRRYMAGGFPKADRVKNARAPVLREFTGGVGFFVRLGVVESSEPGSFAKAAPRRAVFEVVGAEGGRS